MALASFGKYSKKIQLSLNKFLKYNKETGDYSLDPVLRFGGKRSTNPRFSEKFINIFGKPSL